MVHNSKFQYLQSSAKQKKGAKFRGNEKSSFIPNIPRLPFSSQCRDECDLGTERALHRLIVQLTIVIRVHRLLSIATIPVHHLSDARTNQSCINERPNVLEKLNNILTRHRLVQVRDDDAESLLRTARWRCLLHWQSCENARRLVA